MKTFTVIGGLFLPLVTFNVTPEWIGYSALSIDRRAVNKLSGRHCTSMAFRKRMAQRRRLRPVAGHLDMPCR
jgi:hypothetical protein